VEIISHPLSFEGRPAELVLANDITERKRAEQALLRERAQVPRTRRERQQHHPALESGGVITFINEFGLKFFGYAEEELLGQQVVGTIVHGDGKQGQRSASADGGDQPASRRV
jgi:PAS domain-containing protein